MFPTWYLPMVLLRMMTVRCIGKRYTGFMLQTLGLPLSGDYGQVPAKLWYLHKV